MNMKFVRTWAMLALVMVIGLSVTGGTIAWFTDSVSSTNNIIQSGNLDMKVSWKPYGANNTEWTEVTETTKLFKENALYEPGYTEAFWLKIENVGNLAFKYRTALNIAFEVSGTNKAGETFNLSDYLKVKSAVPSSYSEFESFYTTRESLSNFSFGTTANSCDKWLSSEDLTMTANGVAYPANDPTMGEWSSSYVLVVLEMPTDIGNEANHMTGTAAPQITLGLHAEATQLPHEADTFGSDYDANAEYPKPVEVGTLDELKDAFTKGGNIKLTSDIQLEKLTPVEENVEVYLDMNGKKLTVDQNTASNTLIWVKEGAKLVVSGNGTIDLEGVSTMAIFCPYGELVIENGTFKREKSTTPLPHGLFMGAKNSGCNVTINGGYFDGGYYDVNAADIDEILAGTKPFTETDDDIAKRDNAKDANLVRVAVKDNVSAVLNHSGYGSFKVYGGTFVGANPAWGDEGCMLPTTPNYLRPWSYYQGTMLDGQTFHENGIVVPAGYTITKGATADGRPTYTVNYSK